MVKLRNVGRQASGVRCHKAQAIMNVLFALSALSVLSVLSVPFCPTPASAHLSAYKIGIDPGHGGTDPGAVGAYGLEEKTINLTYSLRMQEYLVADGATVCMTRTTDVTMSLAERSSYFNAQDVDYAACNHNNAAGAASADYTGSHVYLSACAGTSGNFAYDIVHRMNEHAHIGFVSTNCSREGVHEDDFHMVRVPTMPAFLQEGAFISNHNQERRMGELYYERNFGWAVYAGLCDRLGVTVPGTPTFFRVENLGDGRVRLRWTAVSGANGYRIYTSSDGDAFGSDTILTGTECIYSGLPLNVPIYFCVAAHIQDGGGHATIGYQSEVLGCVPSTAALSGRVLVVNAFDRQADDLGNLRNFVKYHGDAISAAGYPFDAVSDECVSAGTVALTGYGAVDFLTGQASTPDSAVSTPQQTAITNYLAAGGKLFITGSEIGYDLEPYGTTGDQDFLHNILRTDYVADDAGVYSAAGSAGGIFDGITSIAFWDDDNGPCQVDFPDCYAPLSGATVNMTYPGTAYSAGITYDGTCRIVHLGFPFEAVRDLTKRRDIMARVLTFFDLGPVTPTTTIILECRDALGNLTPTPTYREFGVWSNSTAKSTAEGLTGLGSRFSDTSVLDSRAMFEPSISQRGIYRVWVTWGPSGNATHVKYTVRASTGAQDFYLDQDGWGGAGTSNANTWILLGDFEFRAGPDSSACAVVIDETTVTGRPSAANLPRCYTDAVKFQLITPLAVQEALPSVAPNGLRVWPNPTSEYAWVVLPEGFSGLGTLDLWDVVGRMVSYQTVEGRPGSQILLRGIEPGRYLLRLGDGARTWEEELVRER